MKRKHSWKEIKAYARKWKGPYYKMYLYTRERQYGGKTARQFFEDTSRDNSPHIMADLVRMFE